MTAFEKRPHAQWAGPVLLPAPFRWRDPKTQLVHHGAVLQNIRGRVLGYTVLCTEVLGSLWEDHPADEHANINCIECLGAREQDE